MGIDIAEDPSNVDPDAYAADEPGAGADDHPIFVRPESIVRRRPSIVIDSPTRSAPELSKKAGKDAAAAAAAAVDPGVRKDGAGAAANSGGGGGTGDSDKMFSVNGKGLARTESSNSLC